MSARELDEKAMKLLFRRTRQVLEKAIKYQADQESMPRSFLLDHRGLDGSVQEMERV